MFLLDTRVLLLLTVLVMGASPVRAAAVPVGPVPGPAQLLPAVLVDPAGGALITFKTADGRAGAVHVDLAGNPDGGPGFAPTLLPFTLGTTEPLRVGLFDGGHVALASDHATAGSAALTRLGPGGATDQGFPVALGMTLRRPALVPGEDGRTLLVAKNSDATTWWTLRAAVVAADGTVLHAVELPSALQFFNADRIEATSDGAGGLIAMMSFYSSQQTGSKDLCAFRFAADGTRPWGDQPVIMVSLPRDQVDPQLVPDGAGGVHAAWTDPRSRSGSTDIYALRIDGDGSRHPGWMYYGRPVCDAPGPQSEARLVRDAGNGAWVAWLDQRNDAGDLRFSLVRGDGELGPGFTTDGAVLCEAPGTQRELAMAPDGAGGFYAVWRDDRSGEPELYAQHVMGSGLVAPGWPAHGRAIVEANGTQDQPAIAALPGGRALVAWRDSRDGVARIFALTLDSPGNTAAGPAAPRAIALTVAGPARSVIRATCTLADPGAASLEVLDVSGRVRERVALAGPLREQVVTLPTAGLAPGVHFVRLRNAHGAATARACLLR